MKGFKRKIYKNCDGFDRLKDVLIIKIRKLSFYPWS